MKKKILFVAPNLHHGGAEAVLIKILNNINLDLFDVKLVLVKKEGGHLSKLKEEINIIDLDCKSAIFSIPKLKRVIELEKPDIVFSIIGHINLILSSLKLLFFKKVTFIGRENIVYSEWLFKNMSQKKRVLSFAYKALLRKLDYVIVQSKYMAKQVQDYFKVNSNNVVVLNNPIEHSKIELLGTESISEDLWRNDKVNLIAVGRIEKVKNYSLMVDIMEKLPQNFHLNILGDGNERGNLEGYITNKGLDDRVTIHGFVGNPYKYMKQSFALLLTSTRESFPNVVIEANACGTYVFSFNMPGGISEIIKNNLNGDLIPEGNIDDFVGKILEKYESGYDSQAIIKDNKKYSIDDYMDGVYKLFE
ncbi:glycosyltransferase [Sporosarcina sp. UB5]|uniref:glycosyltransferase n=1 Tax=Sporosarcina sp. UB5 TaxID=3047463 RepID=UPI003D7A1284